jgi:hypothetical protein
MAAEFQGQELAVIGAGAGHAPGPVTGTLRMFRHYGGQA